MIYVVNKLVSEKEKDAGGREEPRDVGLGGLVKFKSGKRNKSKG